LKRIIKRKKFLADKAEEQRLKIQRAGSFQPGIERKPAMKVSEMTPLTAHSGSEVPPNQYTDGGDASAGKGDDVDLFPVLIEEMEKVSKFFIGKLASLRIALEEITVVRKNSYRSHHTSSDSPYLLHLRDIYIDLAALRSYCNLNRTGFYKIVKKYDKAMGENNLEAWMRTIDRQPFSNNSEPVQLMEIVTSLVSRDKLIEWEHFATEQQLKSADDIFPSVHFLGLLLSVSVFIVSLSVPYIIPNDPAASRCLSLLLFVICLWITEAIPYFATALMIPILVTVMGVLKEPNTTTNNGLMSPEAAATFVADHIFNHTTMLLLGGYTISTAFSRCQLELRIASILQNRLGDNPQGFILAVMFLGLFLSMWISNHTAPILCATIILPIVRDLPTDSKYALHCILVLGYD
jgi:phosphate transporter